MIVLRFRSIILHFSTLFDIVEMIWDILREATFFRRKESVLHLLTYPFEPIESHVSIFCSSYYLLCEYR